MDIIETNYTNNIFENIKHVDELSIGLLEIFQKF